MHLSLSCNAQYCALAISLSELISLYGISGLLVSRSSLWPPAFVPRFPLRPRARSTGPRSLPKICYCCSHVPFQFRSADASMRSLPYPGVCSALFAYLALPLPSVSSATSALVAGHPMPRIVARWRTKAGPTRHLVIMSPQLPSDVVFPMRMVRHFSAHRTNA